MIGALFAGSFYVLLPTILQEDAESRLAAEAATVNAPAGTRPKADLKAEFDVAKGDAEALAKSLEQRLVAAGVPHTQVVVDGGQVVARLTPGAREDVVTDLATQPGHVELYAPSGLTGGAVADPGAPDLGKLPAGLGEALSLPGVDLGIWTKRLPELANQPPPAGVAALPVQVASTTAGAPAHATLTGPLPEPFAVVAVDEHFVGVVVPGASDATFYPLAGVPDPTPILVAGELPGRLALPAAAPTAAQPDAEQGEAPVAASNVPDWLINILPNTKMALGLDLQGGIDLTLQVELDDAVQGQVGRDATNIRERATKSTDIPIEEVRTERSDPVIWVTSPTAPSALQSALGSSLSDYEYVSSQGNAHAFRMRESAIAEVEKSAVDQVLETLRKRVNETGVKEPSIVKKGGGRINVQLPGKVDLQSAVDALGTTAVLEFRLVEEEADPRQLDLALSAAKTALPEDQFTDDEILNDWLWTQKKIDDDHIVQWEYSTDAEPKRTQPILLKRPVVLTGSDINDAGVNWDENQQPYVSLNFKPHGAKTFCDVTTSNVGKRFAIVLDDRISSAPVIRDKICGGQAKIDMNSGDNPTQEAQTLALVLRTGSLDAPVVVGEVRNVGAQLGKDSVNAGLEASIIGSLFVVAFMLVWYKLSGVVANIALAANVSMMMAGLALFGATLTLPGIAGIALTVGMAVDANIIIYERIRDELRAGANTRKAVDLGFENATSSILDSNITTAIAGIVLYSYGTGPIRGFAVTLLVGIVTTVISALFVSRSLMELQARYSTSRLSI